MSAPTPSRDITRRPLPRELLSQIASYITDTNTIINFARICRFTSDMAEYRIWDTLRLYLPRYYGEGALVQPLPQGAGAAYQTWALKAALEAEQRRRAALKLKAHTVMCRSNERKWSLVDALKLDARLGAVWGIMAILELVAPTLTSLEFVEPHSYPWDHIWMLPCVETLEMRMISCGIHFQSLTTMDLRRKSIRNYGFLAVLVNSAPNLANLSIEVFGFRRDINDIIPIPFPSFDSTSIRRFNVTFSSMAGTDDDALDAISQLLVQSPSLAQLSVSHRGEPVHPFWKRIATAIQHHASLIDLRWTISPAAFELAGIGAVVCPSLKRLVIECDNAMEALNLPKYTNLESLWFEIPPPHHGDVINWSHVAFPFVPEEDIPDISRAILRAPSLQSLRYIHSTHERDFWAGLEGMDEEVNIVGLFRSYQSPAIKDSHLGQVRVLMEAAEQPAQARQYVRRTLDDGSVVYDKRKPAVWREWAVKGGCIVPAGIVERMRKAYISSKLARADDGSWDGRGVVVNENVWSIVVKWLEDDEDDDEV